MTTSGRAEQRVDVTGLARRLHSTLPELDEQGRRVALATYRTLAHGEPVPDYAVAAAAGMDIADVQAVLRPWPDVHRNAAGRIVGFYGLTIQETRHRMIVDDVRLYGWCAWDALFLPGILGRPATVRSSSGATGRAIGVEVADGTVAADPASAAVSFLDPGRGGVDAERIISAFCHHVLFFSSTEEGEEWARDADADTLILSADDAFDVGRVFNWIRFGLD